MSLVISISGIRGTIGGKPSEGLTPIDTVQFTSAYASWLIQESGKERPSVALGRDARISGPMVEQLVSATLSAMGVDVYLMGLATTPTVEIAVTEKGADGGIILTASHNPAQWNALKLLNGHGEFLSGADGEVILKMARANDYSYADVKNLGSIKPLEGMGVKHIDKVLELDLVKPEKIKKKKFRVAIDCVNSVGGIILPQLLNALGVDDVIELYCDPTGDFPHNPEPLPENLTEISELMVREKADVGFVVDPDVDRLAIVCEDGSMFGEEYTLVAISDYILSRTPGNTASNLSSTRALRDVTEGHGQAYFSSAVGEVNVVNAMKANDCVIGGEGNGGIIYPALHYGRDALVGIALFLTHLAESGMDCSVVRKCYPDYYISKNKITLPEGADADQLLAAFEQAHAGDEINTVDGVKVDMPEGWVHLRKSNTEPIIRLYAEALSSEEAERIAGEAMQTINELMN
ncbi:MAG: phosphoglucosamine mutase [Bacteroidetes bacterium]|nr:MAG: phosphoglucosamine mutase [Bacteroidota bacterium]RLD94162.1 MAG: phosphoglucosamine mutase [Bacteroidota bacterium]